MNEQVSSCPMGEMAECAPCTVRGLGIGMKRQQTLVRIGTGSAAVVLFSLVLLHRNHHGLLASSQSFCAALPRE